ncbi:hypothetical protein JIQ42_04833 [Leishmania sp. Namibia]|uniref:hypothetical protein n=1 Tax=Leishmania sp. Namibia TaxID=2802991 RepID=UPI001B63AAC0|nr:hypothetical protein JIQ42_04833 [Leishmania sp. Namibia]
MSSLRKPSAEAVALALRKTFVEGSGGRPVTSLQVRASRAGPVADARSRSIDDEVRTAPCHGEGGDSQPLMTLDVYLRRLRGPFTEVGKATSSKSPSRCPTVATGVGEGSLMLASGASMPRQSLATTTTIGVVEEDTSYEDDIVMGERGEGMISARGHADEAVGDAAGSNRVGTSISYATPVAESSTVTLDQEPSRATQPPLPDTTRRLSTSTDQMKAAEAEEGNLMPLLPAEGTGAHVLNTDGGVATGVPGCRADITAVRSSADANDGASAESEDHGVTASIDASNVEQNEAYVKRETAKEVKRETSGHRGRQTSDSAAAITACEATSSRASGPQSSVEEDSAFASRGHVVYAGDAAQPQHGLDSVTGRLRRSLDGSVADVPEPQLHLHACLYPKLRDAASDAKDRQPACSAVGQKVGASLQSSVSYPIDKADETSHVYFPRPCAPLRLSSPFKRRLLAGTTAFSAAISLPPQRPGISSDARCSSTNTADAGAGADFATAKALFRTLPLPRRCTKAATQLYSTSSLSAVPIAASPAWRPSSRPLCNGAADAALVLPTLSTPGDALRLSRRTHSCGYTSTSVLTTGRSGPVSGYSSGHMPTIRLGYEGAHSELMLSTEDSGGTTTTALWRCCGEQHYFNRDGSTGARTHLLRHAVTKSLK